MGSSRVASRNQWLNSPSNTESQAGRQWVASFESLVYNQQSKTLLNSPTVDNLLPHHHTTQPGRSRTELWAGWLFVYLSGQAVNWLNLLVPAQRSCDRLQRAQAPGAGEAAWNWWMSLTFLFFFLCKLLVSFYPSPTLILLLKLFWWPVSLN